MPERRSSARDISIRLCINSALFYGCFYAFKSPYLNLTLTFSNTVGFEVHTLSAALNKTDTSLFCASTECSMGNPLHTLILSVRLDVTGKHHNDYIYN